MQSNQEAVPWLTEVQLGQLLVFAAEQFNNDRFDLNKVARNTTEWLKIHSQNISSAQQGASIISKEVVMACYHLGETPRYFIDLINQEIIVSHSQNLTLNSRNGQLAQRWLKDYQKKLGLGKMRDYMLSKKFRSQMYTFLNAVARKMAQLYVKCAKMFKELLDGVNDKTKKSKLMNNFMLYKMLRELSQISGNYCMETATQTILRFCPRQTLESFCRYLTNKFQIVRFFANSQIDEAMFEPSMLPFLKMLQKNKNIELKYMEAFCSDGRFAIFIKTKYKQQEDDKELVDYVVVMDPRKQIVTVINCQVLVKDWFVMQSIKTKMPLSEIVIEYLTEGQARIEAIKKHSPEVALQKLMKCSSLQKYTNVNGVLGRCIYLIKKYESPGQFFIDISKRALLSRSFQQIMSMVPLVGYLIAVGTFGAGFYSILSNKFSTEGKKIKELGSLVMTTASTVGSSIVGGIAGQMLIPIPVVGAFIGTVFGGYFGEKGAKYLNSWIEKRHFKKIIQYLQKQQIDRCFWLDKRQFFEVLQIKQENFRAVTPPYLTGQVFATLVAFVLVSFYQAKRLVDYNQKITKESESMQKRVEEEEWQEQAERIEQKFKTQFDIKLIAEFLQGSNGYLYEHYDTIEKSILSFMSKIIQ